MVAARPSWPKLRLSNKCSDSYQVRMKNAPSLITLHLMHNGRKVSMTTEPGTRIDQKFEAGHFYEHKLLGYITRMCRSGVFLDVGENCGQHAVYFALFCPSTLVYCVEPLPDHVNLIRRNIADNHLQSKVRVLPMAAGEIGRASCGERVGK